MTFFETIQAMLERAEIEYSVESGSGAVHIEVESGYIGFVSTFTFKSSTGELVNIAAGEY